MLDCLQRSVQKRMMKANEIWQRTGVSHAFVVAVGLSDQQE